MSLLSTRAILLRAHPFSETSLILRFFTRERGLVSVMARGVRKRGTSPEIFSSGVLVLYYRTNRDLQNYREFSVVHAHRALADDVRRFAGASLFADLVLHHAGEEPSAVLFAGLDASLGRLAEAPAETSSVLILSSAWALVSLMGYAPELNVCVECGDELDDSGVGRLDYAAGGVRCPGCAGPGSEAPRIGPRAREQLGALLLGEPVEGLDRIGAHVKVLRNYVHHHISGSRPLPSFPFLESVVGEAV